LPGLTSAVREYRTKLLRNFMRAGGYDALIFTSADWFEWTANHYVAEQAWERPYLLVLTVSGFSFAIMSELGRHLVTAERSRGTLWIDAVTYYRELPDQRGSAWSLPQWPEMVADALQTAGLGRSRIASDGLTGALATALETMPSVSHTPAGEALRELRWIKHSEEIATMQVAASLSEWGMEMFRGEIRPERLVTEVDYLVCARIAAEAAHRFPLENFVISKVQTLSGACSACPHGDGALTAKVFEKGRVAVSVISTRLNGLATELARPWLVGSPDEHTIALFDCALAAQVAAIDAAVARRPVSGISAAAHDVIEQAGFGALSLIRSVHGIGVVMHDFPHDAAFVQRDLIERETYVIEPGLYLPTVGGFRFADAVVISAGEAHQLTKANKTRALQTLS
jgi:Xaa-Pro aminopeptidase